MSPYLKWLIAVIVIAAAVLILAPVVIHAIQNRDFQRQVEGKQPMRELKEDQSLPQEPSSHPELDAVASRIKAESMQNLIGPK